MDLYIRSQDKEALLKVNNGLMYWEDTDKRHTIVIKETSTNLSILGAYTTKERALEVLDEIQKYLTPTIQMLNETIGNKEVCQIGTIMTIVFEMPLD